ncbi:unnamed protein product [Closterium sp. NIES-54]
MTGILTWCQSGHGFVSRCLHMYAVAAARSPGGLWAHSDPLLNKPFYPNGLVVGILTCYQSEGLGFESQCVHFGHPSAGGCQRSIGDPRLILGKGYRLVVLGGYGRTDPLLNKPFYPNGPEPPCTRAALPPSRPGAEPPCTRAALPPSRPGAEPPCARAAQPHGNRAAVHPSRPVAVPPFCRAARPALPGEHSPPITARSFPTACTASLSSPWLPLVADGLSLFDLTSGASPAPAADADPTVRSQWATRDAAARLAVRRHLPSTERAHFSQCKTAQTLYDAVVARYSSPATAALSRLALPFLFPDLAAFHTVADLITHLRTLDTRYRAALPADFCTKNPPPMYLTLYFLVTRLPDSLRVVRDHFLAVCPTTLTVDSLETALLAAEQSIVAIGASRGDPRTPIFEGCSPSPLLPSVASAATADLGGLESVGAASASSCGEFLPPRPQLPHIHPPQRELQQWETKEEEEKGRHTPATPYAPPPQTPPPHTITPTPTRPRLHRVQERLLQGPGAAAAGAAAPGAAAAGAAAPEAAAGAAAPGAAVAGAVAPRRRGPQLVLGPPHSAALPVASPCPACRVALLAVASPCPASRVALLDVASPCPVSRVALLAVASPCCPRTALLPTHRPALPALSRPAARTALLRAALLLAPPCCCPPCCAQPCWPAPCYPRAALLAAAPLPALPCPRRPAVRHPTGWRPAARTALLRAALLRAALLPALRPAGSRTAARPAVRRPTGRRPALPWLRTTLP